MTLISIGIKIFLDQSPLPPLNDLNHCDAQIITIMQVTCFVFQLRSKYVQPVE